MVLVKTLMKPVLSKQTLCGLSKNIHQISTIKQMKESIQPNLVHRRNMQNESNVPTKDPELAKKMRRFQIAIATCFAFAIGTYCFTLYSIQQEKFLDDFDMPEQIDRTQKDE